MAFGQGLSTFLPSVGKRTFKQAAFAVCDDDVALDVVQGAMIKLAEEYGGKPRTELPLPFQRILQNTTCDWLRRAKVRNTWASLLSSFRSGAEDDDIDPLELIGSGTDTTAAESSTGKVERSQMLEVLEREIEKLSTRQREASLMHYWEDMDVVGTAQAMGCFEGSVKTHCLRVAHALAQALRARGIRL